MMLSTILLVFLYGFPQAIENTSGNEMLFFIERSKDANKIIYDVNLDENGGFNQDNPLNIYWIKATKNNKKESLTWIQDKYAYGIKVLSSEADKVRFQFAPYDKQTFLLSKNQEGSFVVTAEIDGKNLLLESIFIQIDGGTFWVPKINKIDIRGKCMKSQQKYISTIHPSL